MQRILEAVEQDVVRWAPDAVGICRLHRKRHTHRYLRTLRQIGDPCSAGRVLEIGAWPYLFTSLIARSGYDLTSVDTDVTRMSTFIRKTGLRVMTADLDKSRLPLPDKSVDTVLLTEVLEHLCDPLHALLEANRVLRPGGRLVLTTPNLYYLPRIGLYLLGRGAMPPALSELAKQYSLGSRGHIREYTLDEVRQFLRSTGFSIRRARHVCYDRVALRSSLLAPLARVMDVLLRLVPQWRGTIEVVAEKVMDPALARHLLSTREPLEC